MQSKGIPNANYSTLQRWSAPLQMELQATLESPHFWKETPTWTWHMAMPLLHCPPCAPARSGSLRVARGPPAASRRVSKLHGVKPAESKTYTSLHLLGQEWCQYVDGSFAMDVGLLFTLRCTVVANQTPIKTECVAQHLIRSANHSPLAEPKVSKLVEQWGDPAHISSPSQSAVQSCGPSCSGIP